MKISIILIAAISAALGFSTPHCARGGNVVFVHIDGAGISHWHIARAMFAGPDGDLHWDQLPEIAVYRGHMSDSLTASSNGGATVHAYGTRAHHGSFGADREGNRIVNLEGTPASLMHQAIETGLATGLVNSGSIIEPGTSAFVATVKSRSEDSAAVALQVVESGVDVILGGGEEWLLPKGVKGRHAAEGRREDGRNLIEEIAGRGYTIVYTPEELEAVPTETEKLLGVFSAEDTFNDMKEDLMLGGQLPPYKPGTPTLAQMVAAALRILSRDGRQFFLVAEEEGVDNFGNNTNATGAIAALQRGDEALGVVRDFLQTSPDTLLVTTADSEAGGMELLGYPPEGAYLMLAEQRRDPSGAEWDRDSSTGKPFVALPDKNGVQLPFVVTWATTYDVSGGILVRAAGYNAETVRGSMTNSGVYELMRETLFEPGAGTPDRDATAGAVGSTQATADNENSGE